MCDAFISYPSQDRAKARQFKSLLEALGYNAFLDVDSIIAGDDWASKIQDAMRSALVKFDLITPASGDAFFQTEERLTALDNGASPGGDQFRYT